MAKYLRISKNQQELKVTLDLDSDQILTIKDLKTFPYRSMVCSKFFAIKSRIKYLEFQELLNFFYKFALKDPKLILLEDK